MRRQVSPEARDLVASMLQPDPQRRATLAQVADHPWLALAVPWLPPSRVNDQVMARMVEM